MTCIRNFNYTEKEKFAEKKTSLQSEDINLITVNKKKGKYLAKNLA